MNGYGGSIWSTFLEERYGTKDGPFLLAFWGAMAQPGRGEEPAFVAGPETLGAPRGIAEGRVVADHHVDGAIGAAHQRVGSVLSAVCEGVQALAFARALPIGTDRHAPDADVAAAHAACEQRTLVHEQTLHRA